MKLLLLFILFLTGCGEGFSVKEYGRSKTIYEYYYECEHSKPLFSIDVTVAVCGTKEECNKICETKRKELKDFR